MLCFGHIRNKENKLQYIRPIGDVSDILYYGSRTNNPRTFTHHSKKVIFKYRKIKVHFLKNIYVYIYYISIIYTIFFWIVGICTGVIVRGYFS